MTDLISRAEVERHIAVIENFLEMCNPTKMPGGMEANYLAACRAIPAIRAIPAQGGEADEWMPIDDYARSGASVLLRHFEDPSTIIVAEYEGRDRQVLLTMFGEPLTETITAMCSIPTCRCRRQPPPRRKRKIRNDRQDPRRSGDRGGAPPA